MSTRTKMPKPMSAAMVFASIERPMPREFNRVKVLPMVNRRNLVSRQAQKRQDRREFADC